MNKFVSIKDVELNEMKKKELVKTNGGFAGPIVTTGMFPNPDQLPGDFRLPKPWEWPF